MAIAKKLDGSETGFVKALSVLNEAGGDIAEEKLEIIFGGIDFSHLLKQHGAAGTVARIINAVHPDARLVALSTFAAYIDHRRDINPALKFVLVAALRAAPQALTAMLAAKQPIDEKTLANALEVKVKQVEGRELYVGSKRTDLIHDYAFHPAAKDDVVNRGSLVDILQRFDRNLLCPDCFREEINRGRVVIETKVDLDPLDGLDQFLEKAKAKWVANLFGALLRVKHEDTDKSRSSRDRKLAQMLAKAVAEKPGVVERMVPEALPELGQDVDLSALPDVDLFLAKLEMRSEFQSPSTPTEIKDKWNTFLHGLPAGARMVAEWFRGMWDDEGTSGDVKQLAKRLLNVFVRLLKVATFVLVVLLVAAAFAMACSVVGIFSPSLKCILVGMVGVIVLRYAVPTYDMFLNAVSAVFDFLDPTDGTGMVGGTVKGFVDMFKDVHRVKLPAEDREQISWFTDRSISVSIAWAMVSALGCYYAMVLAPMAAPPATALMLAGALWLYASLETLRKGWRRVGKHDEERYVPASWRKRLYRSSFISMTVIGLASFLSGLGLALWGSIDGSAVMLATYQASSEHQAIAAAISSGVDFPTSSDACSKGLAQLNIDATALSLTVNRICELANNEFPCTCR